MMQQYSIVRTGVSKSLTVMALVLGHRLESGLKPMSSHKLTVADPMKLRLPSACATAQGDKCQPDQTVHLAAAILFCGFVALWRYVVCLSDAGRRDHVH
jgi:hypothetical protein